MLVNENKLVKSFTKLIVLAGSFVSKDFASCQERMLSLMYVAHRQIFGNRGWFHLPHSY